MSVIDVTQMREERGGKKDVNNVEVYDTFQITTDNVEDSALVVMDAPDLPQPGDAHPDDEELWVNNLDPKPDGDGQVWKVKVNYTRRPSNIATGTSGSEPWQIDAVSTFGFVSKSSVADKCYAVDQSIPVPPATTKGEPGVRVLNSAQQPFDPPVMDEDYFAQISIVRNIKDSSFTSQNIFTYENTINSGAVVISGITVPRWQALCKSYKAGPTWTGKGDKYWTEQIDIVLNPDEWLRKIVDQGILTIVAKASGDPASDILDYVAIEDNAGRQINEPVLLDGFGARLGHGEVPVILEFHVKWELDWTDWLPTVQ